MTHARYPTAEIEALAEEMAATQERNRTTFEAARLTFLAVVRGLELPGGSLWQHYDKASVLALIADLEPDQTAQDVEEGSWERARDEEMAQ